MKTKALVLAAIAACLTSSAFAQTYEYRERLGDRYERSGYAEQYDRGDRYDGYDRFDRYDRYDRGDNQYRGYRPRMEGAGPHGNLYVGSRLPKPFWTVSHTVDYWRRARLSPPEYRSHWVRVGNDFVLVSETTGRILRVVMR